VMADNLQALHLLISRAPFL